MKKYSPSGYQIININVTGKTSGTAFTPETEDEKILYDLLETGKVLNKPILLNIITSNHHFMGFAIYDFENDNIVIELQGIIETIGFGAKQLLWIESTNQK